MKKIRIRFISFIMIICCVVLSCAVPVLSVNATALPVVEKLASWFLTTVGAVQVGDGVRKCDTITAVKDKITELINNGNIYISDNGDYIFNNDSTQQLYEALDSNSNYDARAVSSFPSIADGLEGFNDDYVNAEFYNAYGQIRLDYKDGSYLEKWEQFREGSVIKTFCTFYDISNISYLKVSSGYQSGVEYTFCDNNGRATNCLKGKRVYIYYYTSDSHFDLIEDNNNYNNNSINTYNPILKYSDYCDIFYNNFPFISTGSKVYAFRCNRSIMLAKDAISANAFLNQTTGVFYNNSYNVLPNVSEETINNNNWDNIYNSYVQTVNNEYQTIYDENGSVTGDEIRNILKNTSDNLEEIIQNATQEITEDIENSNEWLKKIYDRLAILESHFSSVENYQDDYLNALENIENKVNEMSADTVYLVEIYSYLDTIVNAINNNSGGGGGGVRFPDIVDTLPDMPDTDIMDIMSRSAVLVSALETVAPLAYLPLIEGLLMSLSAEPETPVFEIPFVIDNDYIHIDKKVVIDFSYVSDLQVVFNALIHIIFIVFLIYLTFELSDIVGNILF